MFDFGTLVIPFDIVAAVTNSGEKQGWLGGSSLQKERVFVVTSATLAGAGVPCAYFDKLLSHRAFQRLEGVPTSALLKWFTVEAGFSATYPTFQWIDTEELAANLGVNPSDLTSADNKVICVIEPSDKGPKVRPFLLQSDSRRTQLLLMDAIIVPETTNPFSRIPSEFTAALKEKRVSIVGVGSGGGQIALNLACAGVGALDFFDDDHLHPENYIFHPLTRRDLGRNKVLGVADDLRDRNLHTNIETHIVDVVIFADYFREKLSRQKPDIIVCATDTRDSRRFLNLCAVGLKIPLIIAGTLNAGRIGEVMSILPYETACYECIRIGLGATLDPADAGERAVTPYLGGESPDLQSAVQRFDINFVASLATRVALQVLDPSRYPKLPADYLIWGREKSSEHAPPFAFDYPLSVNFAQMLRRVDCPVCGVQPSDIQGIDIDGRFGEILAGLDRL
jgi:molybdopterin/thiamine biosynthesis adenylyltransferase